ncbi:MAG TPA: DUF4893 domain-containing protein, partial [Sphingomicrobium sp.]|nr:DUF4893 domain-containing protein [Sphingomicrobium sp.]
LLVECSGRGCHLIAAIKSEILPVSKTFTHQFSLAIAMAVGGCVPVKEKPRAVVSVVEPTKADEWQGIASAADQQRLANVSGAWAAGLADARRGGFTTALRDDAELIKSNAALARPAPTPGSYSCRLVKLGGKPAFEKFKPFFCYVEVDGNLLTIVKQTGSQRPAGRLWEDDIPTRLIFLGSLALGDEEVPLAYGDNPRRDMAGILERTGPFRWRLVIPWPQDGSKLHAYELTPVANQPE